MRSKTLAANLADYGTDRLVDDAPHKSSFASRIKESRGGTVLIVDNIPTYTNIKSHHSFPTLTPLSHSSSLTYSLHLAIMLPAVYFHALAVTANSDYVLLCGSV